MSMLQKPIERRYVQVHIEIPINDSCNVESKLFEEKACVWPNPFMDGIIFGYPYGQLGVKTSALLSNEARILSTHIEKRKIVYIDNAGKGYTRGMIFDIIHEWIRSNAHRMDWIRQGDGSISQSSRMIYDMLVDSLAGESPHEQLAKLDPDSIRPQEAVNNHKADNRHA